MRWYDFSIAGLLIVLAYLTGTDVINAFVSLFDLFLIVSLIYIGIKQDSINKKYYYFLAAYLFILGILHVSQLGLISIALVIAPHIWFIFKIKSTVSDQIAKSYYFIISPIVIVILYYALSPIGLFNQYYLSPINWISRFI